MRPDELKKIQAPLKQKYTEEPENAIITLKAQGRTGERISCKVDSGRTLSEAGLHPATGGDGSLLCSGDMLLEALVACAGVTLSAVASALEVDIKDGIIKAEGDLDFRGTLGVSKEVPVGFRDIRLLFEIETDADDEKLKTLLKLTERYCVVLQTIRSGTSVNSDLRRK
jgi:uncharacterized OsmC-like protein